MEPPLSRQNWLTDSSGRSKWTKPVLERLLDFQRQGMSNKEMIPLLRQEFGSKAPKYAGEVKAELDMLKIGPQPRMWNAAMETRVKEYVARGMDVHEITNELFHEFAKPDSGRWQQTYRKIQQMKLDGEID